MLKLISIRLIYITRILLAPVFYLNFFYKIEKKKKKQRILLHYSTLYEISVSTNNAVQQIEKRNLPLKLASLYFNLPYIKCLYHDQIRAGLTHSGSLVIAAVRVVRGLRDEAELPHIGPRYDIIKSRILKHRNISFNSQNTRCIQFYWCLPCTLKFTTDVQC